MLQFSEILFVICMIFISVFFPRETLWSSSADSNDLYSGCLIFDVWFGEMMMFWALCIFFIFYFV